MKVSNILFSVFGSLLFYFFAKHMISNRESTLIQAVFLASVMTIGLLISDFGGFVEKLGKRNFKHISVKLSMVWLFGFVGTILLVYDTSFFALIGIIFMSLVVTLVNRFITR